MAVLIACHHKVFVKLPGRLGWQCLSSYYERSHRASLGAVVEYCGTTAIGCCLLPQRGFADHGRSCYGMPRVLTTWRCNLCHLPDREDFAPSVGSRRGEAQLVTPSLLGLHQFMCSAVTRAAL
jgi:hypothetical protein